MKNKISLETLDTSKDTAARVFVRSIFGPENKKVDEPRHWSSSEAEDAFIAASLEVQNARRSN